MIEKAYTNAALRDLFDFEAKAVPLKEGGVKSLNLCDSHLRHNFGGVGSGEWGVGSGELITSPPPLPIPYSLLPSPYCFFPVNVPSPSPARLTLPFIVVPSVVPA